MAFSYNGSTSAMSIPDINSVGTYSWFVRAKRNNTGSGNDAIVAADNYPTTPREEAMLAQYRVGDAKVRFEITIGGTGAARDTGSIPSVGVWSTFAATRNGTTAKAFFDASQVGADITVGSGNTNFENIRLGCHFFSGGNNEFGDLSLADFAIWGTDLTATELIMLDTGISPLMVRPQSLLRFTPGIRDKNELITAAVITDIGTPAIADSPALVRHGKKSFSFAVAAAPPAGRIMGSLVGAGGLAGIGGLAGSRGGMAG
jgi:hypothetical protein